MAFKVISVSLSEYSVPIPLAFVPLSFVDVFILINHSAFPLGHAAYPVTVISVSVFVEEGPSAMLSILIPITSVFPP